MRGRFIGGLHYNTLEEGLNCKLGEQNSVFNEETKNKMSKARQGYKHPPESEARRQASLREIWDEKNKDKKPKTKYFPKYIITEEHKLNISKGKKGKAVHTEASKQKLREIGRSRDLTKAWKASSDSLSKPVNQYNSKGEFIKKWGSSNEAELFYKKRKGDNIRETIRHFEATGVQWKAYGFIWKSIK